VDQDESEEGPEDDVVAVEDGEEGKSKNGGEKQEREVAAAGVAGEIVKADEEGNQSEEGEFLKILVVKNNLAGLEAKEVVIGVDEGKKVLVKFVEPDASFVMKSAGQEDVVIKLGIANNFLAGFIVWKENSLTPESFEVEKENDG